MPGPRKAEKQPPCHCGTRLSRPERVSALWCPRHKCWRSVDPAGGVARNVVFVCTDCDYRTESEAGKYHHARVAHDRAPKPAPRLVAALAEAGRIAHAGASSVPTAEVGQK